MITTFLPTQVHNPIKKYALGIVALVLLTILFYLFGAQAIRNTETPLPDPMPVPAVMAQSETPECPEGSYNIGEEKNGEPICKLEPTGCPYGDSIPVDSPKCAPPEDPEAAYGRWEPETSTSQNVVTVDKPVETVYNSGK